MATEKVHANDAEEPMRGDETAVTASETIPADAAAQPLTEATGAVWDALVGNPGASTTEIAAAAGMSKPATRRALAALETIGHVTRAPGGHEGGKRTPDTWHVNAATANRDSCPEAGTGPAASEAAAVDGPADSTQTAREQDEDDTAADTPTTDAPDAADGDETHEIAAQPESCDGASAGGDVIDPAALAEALEALSALTAAADATREALQAGDREAALRTAQIIYGGSAKARRLVRAAADGRHRNAAGTGRSHPGELRAKVAAHLAAHPGQEFTPHEIGKAIGHSAGAVVNALDRLIGLGEAVETCERPRRFTAAVTEAATAATA